MGACGCGDFQAEFRLPGPLGVVYAIQQYAPCGYCNTPASVIIHRFSTDGAKTWGVDELPEAMFQTMHGKDFDGQTFALPVIHPELLLKALISASGNPLGMELVVDEDVVADALGEVLFKAGV